MFQHLKVVRTNNKKIFLCSSFMTGSKTEKCQWQGILMWSIHFLPFASDNQLGATNKSGLEYFVAYNQESIGKWGLVKNILFEMHIVYFLNLANTISIFLITKKLPMCQYKTNVNVNLTDFIFIWKLLLVAG